MDWLPFALLGFAIACVWLPPLRLAGANVPAFVLPFAAAVAAGLSSGVLASPALGCLVVLGVCAWSSLVVSRPAARAILTAAAALIALAMALHLAPGFQNPRLVTGIQLSENSKPFTQYLNFDKGAAGLVLLAAYSRRVELGAEFMQVLRVGAVFSGVSIAVVMSASIALGYVEPDLKFPDFAVGFLVTNLFFTCVAEEAFFRGLLQERLQQVLRGRARVWLPVAASATLFGLAHAAGGSTYLALATVAGLGYALVYEKTGRIEAPILVHFAVNATHFLGFTYPSLQS